MIIHILWGANAQPGLETPTDDPAIKDDDPVCSICLDVASP